MKGRELSTIKGEKIQFDIKSLLLGFLIGLITTSAFFLMVGEVETEIRIGLACENEQVGIFFRKR